MLRLFALFEHMTQFVTPWATFIPSRPYFKDGTPITQTTNIVDLSGMGIRKFWSLKNHLQQASQLSTAHYPETLDRIFVSVSMCGHRTDCLRSLELLPSFLQSGAGSSDGSIRSLSARSTSCPAVHRTSSRLCPSLSIHKPSQKSMAVS